MDNQKVDNFAYKTIAAFLAGTVLFLASPHHTLGAAWKTNDTDAEVDVSDGSVTGFSATGTLANTDTLAFGNAGHTLTITDNDTAGTVTNLGNITTVSNGGGKLIFKLSRIRFEFALFFILSKCYTSFKRKGHGGLYVTCLEDQATEEVS